MQRFVVNAKTNKRKAMFCCAAEECLFTFFVPFFQWDSLNLLCQCWVIFCGVRQNRENSTHKKRVHRVD